VPSGRTVPTFATVGAGQPLDLDEASVRDVLDDELGDAVAPVERDARVAIVVDERDSDLATVPGIDGARRVDDRHAVTHGEAGPGMHERDIPRGQCDGDSGANCGAFARSELDVGRRDEVGTGVAGMGVRRKRQVGVEPTQQDRDVHARVEGRAHKEASLALVCEADPVPTTRAHDERLTVPVWWWPVAAGLVVILGAEIHGGLGWAAAFITDGVLAVVTTWALLRLGGLRIVVDSSGLTVGRLRLDAGDVSAVRPLDRADYRHLLGVGADATARLVTRPWVSTGVRIDLRPDAGGPPYWVVSTRSPAALANAVGQVSGAPSQQGS
jgi:DUF3093 family protein